MVVRDEVRLIRSAIARYARHFSTGKLLHLTHSESVGMIKPVFLIVASCGAMLLLGLLAFDALHVFAGKPGQPTPVQCPVKLNHLSSVEANLPAWWCEHCRSFHSTADTSMNRPTR